jgi:hypothetical protein
MNSDLTLSDLSSASTGLSLFGSGSDTKKTLVSAFEGLPYV